jgi:hypothetical protein
MAGKRDEPHMRQLRCLTDRMGDFVAVEESHCNRAPITRVAGAIGECQLRIATAQIDLAGIRRDINSLVNAIACAAGNESSGFGAWRFAVINLLLENADVGSPSEPHVTYIDPCIDGPAARCACHGRVQLEIAVDWSNRLGRRLQRETETAQTDQGPYTSNAHSLFTLEEVTVRQVQLQRPSIF